jgi:hypothetical protein
VIRPDGTSLQHEPEVVRPENLKPLTDLTFLIPLHRSDVETLVLEPARDFSLLAVRFL